jgi:hypothetical protein
MNKFAKKFSLPHNDIQRPIMDGPDNFIGYDNNTEGENFFYTVIDNADQSYRDEIADIYFAKSFLYKFGGTTRRYGDVMGKEATDTQVDNLFKLQEKYDIPISLTINQEIHPVEILMSDVIRNNFIKFLGEFYERGLRMCTISNIHLMGTGHLQKNFPDMQWKNTVNHIVSNTQQMVDLIALGYNMIQLDRSLNRNMSELRRCSKEAKKRGIITYLLASEGCMPHCPFKFEHDSVQPWIGSTTNNSYFDTLADISCNKWRFNKLESHIAKKWTFFNASTLPRIGTSCVWDTNERFDMYNELVDVFKYSGRLGYPYAGSKPESYACWQYGDDDTIFYAKSFKDVYDLEAGVLNNWNGLGCVTSPSPDDHEKYFVDHPPNKIRAKKHLDNLDHPFKTEEGIKMCKALPNCKNQCWNCHLCEDAYGLEHFDSLCEINREPGSGYVEIKDSYKNV